MIISSLAFEQMVTLQLLNPQEPETGESSNEDEEEEEEEQPRSPAQEQSASGSSESSQAPLSRERQGSPVVQMEQVAKEADLLPPQALPTPQEDAQRREEKSTEAEVLTEIKDDSLPPELACHPPQRALGPPTSVPPEPPGPVTVDSECEETLAASPLGNACVGERESSTRLSLTLDPKKGDPLSLEPESPGGEPQPPEFKKEEDVTSSAGPCEELSSTEAGSVAAGAALGPNHSSQRPRCVPLSSFRDKVAARLSLVFPELAVHPSETDRWTDVLFHSFMHSVMPTLRGSVSPVIVW